MTHEIIFQISLFLPSQHVTERKVIIIDLPNQVLQWGGVAWQTAKQGASTPTEGVR
jgi:hypothetical protein